MIYHHNGFPIKLMPRRFAELPGISNYLENEFEKRLSQVERENLTLALFHHRVNTTFLDGFKINNRLEAEQIADALPMAVTKVTTNDRQRYFVLQFSNGAAVRCPGILYNITPCKHQMNFASELRPTKIPPAPGAEQLQLSF